MLILCSRPDGITHLINVGYYVDGKFIQEAPTLNTRLEKSPLPLTYKDVLALHSEFQLKAQAEHQQYGNTSSSFPLEATATDISLAAIEHLKNIFEGFSSYHHATTNQMPPNLYPLPPCHLNTEKEAGLNPLDSQSMEIKEIKKSQSTYSHRSDPAYYYPPVGCPPVGCIPRVDLGGEKLRSHHTHTDGIHYSTPIATSRAMHTKKHKAPQRIASSPYTRFFTNKAAAESQDYSVLLSEAVPETTLFFSRIRLDSTQARAGEGGEISVSAGQADRTGIEYLRSNLAKFPVSPPKTPDPIETITNSFSNL